MNRFYFIIQIPPNRNASYLVINVLINNNLYMQVGLAYQAKRDNVTRHFPINQRIVGLRFFATLKNLTQPTFLSYCLLSNSLFAKEAD